TSCGSSTISPTLPNRRSSHAVSVNCVASNGWSTRSRRSVAPSRCWLISRATPIASPSSWAEFTGPEFLFGRHEDAEIKWIHGNRALRLLAPASDNREHRGTQVGDPHVVLELRHVLFGGGFFGGGLRQHELGLEFGHETSGARRRVVPASDAKNTGSK